MKEKPANSEGFFSSLALCSPAYDQLVGIAGHEIGNELYVIHIEETATSVIPDFPAPWVLRLLLYYDQKDDDFGLEVEDMVKSMKEEYENRRSQVALGSQD